MAEPSPSPSAKSRAANGAVAADSASGGLARQAAPSSSSSPSPSLGTAHGRRENSYVGKTNFERAQSTPDEVVRIRYDSRENLIAAGVIPVPPPPRWPRPSGPSPFPDSDPGYVPDPPRRY